MEAAKAKNWAVELQERKIYMFKIRANKETEETRTRKHETNQDK
jgi:hypothetical protein